MDHENRPLSYPPLPPAYSAVESSFPQPPPANREQDYIPPAYTPLPPSYSTLTDICPAPVEYHFRASEGFRPIPEISPPSFHTDYYESDHSTPNIVISDSNGRTYTSVSSTGNHNFPARTHDHLDRSIDSNRENYSNCNRPSVSSVESQSSYQEYSSIGAHQSSSRDIVTEVCREIPSRQSSTPLRSASAVESRLENSRRRSDRLRQRMEKEWKEKQHFKIRQIVFFSGLVFSFVAFIVFYLTIKADDRSIYIPGATSIIGIVSGVIFVTIWLILVCFAGINRRGAGNGGRGLAPSLSEDLAPYINIDYTQGRVEHVFPSPSNYMAVTYAAPKHL